MGGSGERFLASEDESGGFGVIGACCGGDVAVACAADEGSVGEGGGNGGCVVFGVPTVAEDGEGEARCGDEGFGGEVFFGEVEGRGIRMEETGVDDFRGACMSGGGDDVGVLGGALPEFAGGDEEETAHVLEGGGEGVAVIVGGLPNGDACGGEVVGFGWVADDGDDGRGIDLHAKQVFDDEAAELAGGSGECDHGGGVV